MHDHFKSELMNSNDQQYLSVGRTMSDEIRDSHKTLADLWQGISLFSTIKNCVTVYGSALRPVVCMGRDYWQHMQSFIRETMLAAGTISPGDLELAFLTDDPTEGVEYIRKKISGNEVTREESPDLYW